MDIRVGFGYDVHQLKEGLDLYIGGVKIPFRKGALGHSDADVLIHALCDALLGAANLGDIGRHFPDTSQEYKGIKSTILLSRVYKLLRGLGYRVHNVDASICLQEPKIAQYIPAMKNCMGEILCTKNISVKATTTEKMGFVGRGEGISAYAVALIKKEPD